ncbi:MAG TPA: type I polyketide synthase, partial [Labilithrix sp.]|nr:type I polyketide synthase [Labilithrix sp.]
MLALPGTVPRARWFFSVSKSSCYSLLMAAVRRRLLAGPAREHGGNVSNPSSAGRLEPVAIIGIGCRFPGANGVEAFWRLLQEGRDVVTEVPPSRFDIDALYDPAVGTPGKLVSRWGGFVDDIDSFDAAFFGITGREARHMDPQQRLALEVAVEAVENAGLRARGLKATSAGVFVGISANEYQELEHRDLGDLNVLVAAGGGRNGVAGRISYLLGLGGPSIAIDTDRSSSLVAVHLALSSIRSGESSLALAGATNLVLTPEPSIAFSRAMMLSPDGRCKFGDARANGFVRSDGIAFVVLKKLSAALADGDRIYATILGSAVNHDAGRSGDFLAPSTASQIALLETAYQNAGVRPGAVQYVEAHGPGTQRGDPEEVRALTTVLQRDRDGGAPLHVGSVKTNIGHAEAAAGIAGLIKVALSLRGRTIPASLHFQTPNPKIEFDGIVVPKASAEWPDPTRPLIAGVTSLGLTGTNAHVVLAEAPRPQGQPDETKEAEREELLTISAKNPQSLTVMVERYIELLRDTTSSIHDVAYTACARRDHHGFRLAVVGATRDELVSQLRASLQKGITTGGRRDSGAKVAFVFPGQGSQWLGMGRELMEREPAFRESMERCDDAIRRIGGWSLLEELWADASRSRMNDFTIVQPILVSMEISLAKQWQALGIHPDVVVGTSMGEVAAAHVAGILSLDDAMKVICRRSRLMHERLTGKGAMGVIGLPARDVDTLLAHHRDRVWISGINSPVSTIVAGDPAALDDVLTKIKATGVYAATVKDVFLASHTPHVDEIVDELGAALHDVKPTAACVPMLSSVDGQLVHGGLDAAYWVQNLRQPVMFADAVRQLLASGYNMFVEVSPHPVLVGPIIDCLSQADHKALAIGTLRREEPERRAMLRSVGALYSFGLDIDWERFFPARAPLADLPAYAWKRERYWYSDQPATRTRPLPTASAAVRASETELEPTTGEHAAVHVGTTLARTLKGLQPAERRAVLLEHVRGQVAAVLGMGPELVDVQRPLREIGLTSFWGVELSSLLSGSLGR